MNFKYPIAFVCRSVSYTVNGFYKHHVTVVAEVVAVSLELSTEELVLYPSYGMPAEAGENALPIFVKSMYIPPKGTAYIIKLYKLKFDKIFVNWLQ